MDAEARQSYLESEEAHCPFCESEDIQGDVTRSAKFYDGYERDVRCQECGKAWKDIYTLTEVEEIDG